MYELVWLLPCDEGLVPRPRTARVEETQEWTAEFSVPALASITMHF